MAQIKITIPDDIYSNIKQSAKNNYRTITQEINFKLAQLFNQQSNQQPGNQSIPTPTPKRLEPDVPTPTPQPGPGSPTQPIPIPETPYKITVTSNRLANRV